MLDKNITRYTTINEKQIILGQTSSGVWYCKELPCNTCEEADVNIGKINSVLNKYNNQMKEKTVKLKKPDVKGLE